MALGAGVVVGVVSKIGVSWWNGPRPHTLDLGQEVNWSPGYIRRAPVKIVPVVNWADLVPERDLYNLLRRLTPSWYSFETAM
jgi:hypothetical protein